MKLLQKPLEAYKAQAHKNSFCDRFIIFLIGIPSGKEKVLPGFRFFAVFLTELYVYGAEFSV
jgi:hypothetical protein